MTTERRAQSAPPRGRRLAVAGARLALVAGLFALGWHVLSTYAELFRGPQPPASGPAELAAGPRPLSSFRAALPPAGAWSFAGLPWQVRTAELDGAAVAGRLRQPAPPPPAGPAADA